MSRKKEIAKFLSGVTAHEAIAHSILSGIGVLPMTFFGITVTPGYNAGVIIFWWITCMGLIYYAWFKKS